jgi:hypothetical protein
MLQKLNPFAKEFSNATLFVDNAIINVDSLIASKNAPRTVWFLFP